MKTSEAQTPKAAPTALIKTWYHLAASTRDEEAALIARERLLDYFGSAREVEYNKQKFSTKRRY